MSQFYGDLQGNRGMTTRIGSKDSGIGGHIRGWNVGIRVVGVYEDDEDKFYVYATSGSHHTRVDTLICILTERDITMMSQAEIREGIGHVKVA